MKARTYLILLGILVISIALFYSTPSVSVLYGSHKLYNLTGAGNDVDCTSCHPQVAQELSQSAFHTTLTCEDCHRNPYMKSVALDNGTVVTKGSYAHAAYKPRCLDCHSQTSITKADGTVVTVPKADAFGDPGYGGDRSAHKKFVVDSLNYNIFEGENEACISCHTDYKVKFEFIRPLYATFTINSSWYVSSVTYGPNNTTVVMKPGSGAKHKFKPLTDIKCEDCHPDIWAAAVPGHVTDWNVVHGNGMYGWISNVHYSDWNDAKNGAINITDFCKSCHVPNTNYLVSSLRNEVTHAAWRLSCYDCHINTCSQCHSYTKHYGNAFDNLNTAPFFIRGDTCTSCKENNLPDPTISPVTFKSYFEPNTTKLLQ
ncbi:hypothetical protein [Geoglobus acetivorans]|uniref:Cytochrome c family protein n=1 Tax=Geoglobus acetivorans TaxID=565033 RepID=A0ABZ3H3G4_GEOAI|nr:hypothetical protein [Geoglobus acetivorans]